MYRVTLGLQYLLDVGPDFLVFHKLAALGGGDAPFHAFTKAGAVLLGGEMDFHTPSG
jgi:hypothetical protein